MFCMQAFHEAQQGVPHPWRSFIASRVGPHEPPIETTESQSVQNESLPWACTPKHVERGSRLSHPAASHSLHLIRMPSRIHPSPIPPHKDLRRSPLRHSPLAALLNLKGIRAIQNRNLPKVLHLSMRKFQLQQLPPMRMKLRRSAKNIRLFPPLLRTRTDLDRVCRNKFMQRLHIVPKPRPPNRLTRMQQRPIIRLLRQQIAPTRNSQHQHSSQNPTLPNPHHSNLLIRF